MTSRIFDLIKDVCIDSPSSANSNFTHILTYPEIKKLNISSMEFGDFWLRYCKLVSDGDFACLSEKIPDVIPLIVDLNLKFRADQTDEDNNEYYNDTFILSVISCIQQVIINNFQVDMDSQKELICFFLESEVPYFSEVDIDNESIRVVNFDFRFQFPYCRCSSDIIDSIIYPEIIRSFETGNLNKTLFRSSIFGWREIFDKELIKRGYISLYGSVNAPEESTKKLNRIFLAVNKDQVHGHQDLDICEDPIDALHLDKHPHVINNFIDMDTIMQQVDEEDGGRYWLPLLLSLFNLSQLITQQKTKKRIALTKSQDFDVNSGVKADFDTFFKMCKPERFKNKVYALDLGRIIYDMYENRTDGKKNDEGVDRWKNLLYGYFEDSFYYDNYYSFYDSNISLKTLAYYAREDSPGEYKRWNKNWSIESLNTILRAGKIHDHDVGEFVYRLGWLDFIYSTRDGKDGTWYKFVSPRWRCCGRGIEIRNYMSVIAVDVVLNYINVLLQESISAKDDYTRAQKQNHVQIMQKLLEKLKQTPGKGRFMPSLEEHFHFDGFVRLLDDNPTLISHKNCVSEVVDRKVEFRPGKPEDFILKSTEVRIDQNLNWQNTKVVEVMKWFSQLFPDQELREFMLKYLGSWFEGGNYDKIGPCLCGKSNGGKSTFIKALEHCWRDYLFKFQNSTVYAKKGGFTSSGPTPELAQARGSRAGIVDELEDDIMISASAIKKYLGGDSFFCRFLHDNGGKTKVTFKMMFVTNRIPRMNSLDESIKGKFILIPFLSTWANNITDEMLSLDKYLFRADPNFESSIPSKVPAMLWIFSQYYTKYKTEGLRIPKIVRDISEKYWKDIDHYSLFKNLKITKVVHPETGLLNRDVKLDINRLYSEYKIWFKQTFENERVTTYRDFKIEFIRILGDLDETENFWFGYQLKSEGEDKDNKNQSGAAQLKQMIST